VRPIRKVCSRSSIMTVFWLIHLTFMNKAWLELERRTRLGFTPNSSIDVGMTNPSIFRRLLGEQLSEDEIRRFFSDLKEECYRRRRAGAASPCSTACASCSTH